MKAGDLIRVQQLSGCYLGLLLSYKKWEKIAIVLVKGKKKRVRAAAVTRAGRRDKKLIGGTI
jgi:hypothetical protein